MFFLGIFGDNDVEFTFVKTLNSVFHCFVVTDILVNQKRDGNGFIFLIFLIFEFGFCFCSLFDVFIRYDSCAFCGCNNESVD